MSQRYLLRNIALAVLMTMAAWTAAAQKYPTKPVRVIVPVAPGGMTDIQGRLFAQKLSVLWGQQVMVENRPGGGSIIAADLVSKSPADGYTLFISGEAPFVINPHLYSKLPYDPIRDFTPIVFLSQVSPVIAVHASLPVSNIKELIALAKSKPGSLSYGSMGSGTYSHIAMEEFKRRAGVDITHVPYKGSSPAMTDLLAGHTSIILVNISVVERHANAGKLRIVAAATPRRLQSLPDLPTVSEQALPGFEATTWFAVFGPANLPGDVVSTVHADITKIMAEPGFREQHFSRRGLETAVMTPREFAQKVKNDLERWGPVVKASGARAD